MASRWSSALLATLLITNFLGVSYVHGNIPITAFELDGDATDGAASGIDWNTLMNGPVTGIQFTGIRHNSDVAFTGGGSKVCNYNSQNRQQTGINTFNAYIRTFWTFPIGVGLLKALPTKTTLQMPMPLLTNPA